MKQGVTLKLLRSQLMFDQQNIREWDVLQKQEAMEQYRYDYEYTNPPCIVKPWKNVDEALVDAKACISGLKDIMKLLTSYKNNPDSIPSGAWNNYGRG